MSRIWNSAIAWLISLSLIVLFAAMHNDDIWSAGMDIPHHVALTSYIADHAALPLPSVARLSEMSTYPPGSHVAAAIATKFLGSPIAGMKLVSDLSLVITWMLAVYFLSLLGQRRAWFALFATVLIIAGNKFILGADVIGDEMVLNEFYSQLVGQMLAFSALAACARLETLDKSYSLKYVILAIACNIDVNVHLLPTMVLLTSFGVLWTIDVVVAAPKRRLNRLLVGSSLLVITAGVIYFSGYTKAMREISQVGGSIPLRLVVGLGGMAAVAAATLALCLWLVSQALREELRTNSHFNTCQKYVGAIGVAAGGLCLLQILLYSSFGVGSMYACLKYAFLLGTILILSIAIIASGIIVRTPSIQAGRIVRMPWLLPACIAACGFLAAETTVQVAKLQSTRFLSRLIEVTTAYANGHVSSHRENIAVGISNAFPAGNYLVSLVGLGAKARSPLTLALLYQQALPATDELGDIITSVNSAGWDIDMCRKALLSDGLVALDGQCVVRNSSTFCRTHYDFTTSGGIAMQHIETGGLSAQEIDGTWTDGNEAFFSCELSPSEVGKPLKITIDSSAFLYGTLKTQAMIVSIGSKEATVNFDSSAPQQLVSIDADPPATSKLTVRLAFPNATSPAQIGLSSDSRKLGVKIRDVTIE